MAVVWRQVPITGALARRPFDCGEGELNTYFRRFAFRNHKKRASTTFVAVQPDDERCVLGYYTICPAQIEHDDAPDELKAQFPRYSIAGYKLARLAVDASIHGQGLGGQLLLEAGRHAIAATRYVGGSVLFIDAKNDAVAAWYVRQGAQPLPGDSRQLVIRLESIATALGIEFPMEIRSSEILDTHNQAHRVRR